MLGSGSRRLGGTGLIWPDEARGESVKAGKGKADDGLRKYGDGGPKYGDDGRRRGDGE